MIEAHFLFGIPYDRIDVLLHPTSIVHGLVRFADGAPARDLDELRDVDRRAREAVETVWAS